MNEDEGKIAQRLAIMDGESPDEREARLRSLWQKLDTKAKGTLDLEALKNGLSVMNHRMCSE